MSESARNPWPEHEASQGEEMVGRPGLADLWSWVAIVLAETPITQVDAVGGRGLCALALEVYAPALAVEMEASGIAADTLLFARIAEIYSDRYGSPVGRYTICRLRAVVRSLRRSCGAGPAH